MNAILARIKAEPAVVIGLLATVLLAAAQYAGGHNLLSGDAVAWVVGAFHVPSASDPSVGWAVPLLTGIVTRFFVSPAK